jgi:hypothetical protein
METVEGPKARTAFPPFPPRFFNAVCVKAFFLLSRLETATGAMDLI